MANGHSVRTIPDCLSRYHRFVYDGVAQRKQGVLDGRSLHYTGYMLFVYGSYTALDSVNDNDNNSVLREFVARSFREGDPVSEEEPLNTEFPDDESTVCIILYVKDSAVHFKMVDVCSL